MISDSAVSFADLARALGVRPSHVSALKKAGRLVLTDDGRRALLDASRARIEATKDPAKAGVAARHAAARAARGDAPVADHVARPGEMVAATPTAPEPGADDDDSDTDKLDAQPGRADYQVWRARRERAVALREERANAVEAGKLMAIEQVAEDVRLITAQLRQSLETQLDALIPRLVNLASEEEVRRIVHPEYHEALDRAARDLQSLGRAEA
jgi:hypothetical protein